MENQVHTNKEPPPTQKQGNMGAGAQNPPVKPSDSEREADAGAQQKQGGTSPNSAEKRGCVLCAQLLEACNGVANMLRSYADHTEDHGSWEDAQDARDYRAKADDIEAAILKANPSRAGGGAA